ncbi:DNA mismatch repair protein MutS [uncultured Methanospirillum sp.]|uniref:DNA mismatch repair protein MutS n=1 Tax=uncultured Methanospirillum sp. TaxID=262503 RepID=UPI0029C63246|nr:DNA mismatch repair protein MutS [uncultured Methanospirillum sp.]
MTSSQESGNGQREKPGRVTPAMQQFYEAKRQYPDCVIFFRMGDFYETFCEDAEICAREMEITLTSRGRMPDGQDIPLAGIPFHALDGYLSRMISRGYKVAICEQIEDPKKAKGIVKRDVVRVVTPGTVIDAALLSGEGARYLMAAVPDKKRKRIGTAFLDISTGDFQISEVPADGYGEELRAEVVRFRPAECITPKAAEQEIEGSLRRLIPLISPQDPSLFDPKGGEDLLCRQFGISSLDSLGCSDIPAAVTAAGAALAYAQKTQFDPLAHIKSLSRNLQSEYLVLDAVTLRNLEVVSNIRDRTEEGTLVNTIDMTQTPMGRRLLRRWITAPLKSVEAINQRLDAVEFFTHETILRQDLRQILHRYADLERIAGRISYGNASPRDLVTLSNALMAASSVRTLFQSFTEIPESIRISASGIPDLESLVTLIGQAIVDDPPLLIRKGGVIRDGYHEELDRLRLISRDGRQWVADLEQQEKERTGIKSLKIKYNAVFGFFIEITKANLSSVPPDYERRQTTANGERFTIPALREVESQIATADERLLSLEEELYTALLATLREHVSALQETAHSIARVDLFAGLAEAALKFGYVRPHLIDEPTLLVREGRHPVVEASLTNGFVPNDAEMSASGEQILIITGANMAGKSTYMRSVALIIVMAQMGSFVPAGYAKVGLVDRIFTRVGAFDDLASGQSTFMVEMLELATILNHATEQSLVILDEIGRGTSTLDGYCIARAVLEHLHGKKNKGPRTLFATHFHELVGVETDLKRVRNCHFAVRETDKDVVFLRKLIPGATDRSYGIHVADLAGVPSPVIKRAEDLMKKVMRGEESPGGGVKRYTQMILLDAPAAPLSGPSEPDPIREELESIDVNSLTPLQALSLLADLKSKAKDQA